MTREATLEEERQRLVEEWNRDFRDELVMIALGLATYPEKIDNEFLRFMMMDAVKRHGLMLKRLADYLGQRRR